MDTEAKLVRLQQLLHGRPVFLAGSAVAEVQYGLANAHSDIDLFTPNMNALMATAQTLMHEGFVLHERHKRVWARWQEFGINKWHTNSLRLDHEDLGEVNVIHKLVGGHPLTSLSQVLESFDFGLLAMGYDFRIGKLQDLRGFMFPEHNPNGPLPLMLNKREDWRNGFISQYNGIRQAGRYAKYTDYGYDMSLVKDDLLTGYRQASAYLYQRDKQDKQDLAQIYDVIAMKIELDLIDDLLEASKEIVYLDALDDIMEALE